MTLWNIDVPPLSEETKEWAVGIDLGTTHSLVAYDCHDRLTVLPDEKGACLLPSVVRYTPQGSVVGQEARQAYLADPENTIASVKRWMGSEKVYHTCVGQKTPVEISSEILKCLIERARTWQPGVRSAVITVPAYFDEQQRQATKEAAQIAGIRVLRLLNEPTAAAVAYGLEQETKGTCLVFDLGGGTFDVSVLVLHQGVFEVLATGGDTRLGGNDVDALVASWIASASQLSEALPEIQWQARHAKEALSEQNAVTIRLSNGWEGVLTRSCLNMLMMPVVEKTLSICQQVLIDAKLTVNDLNHILLVGGSTRLIYLQERLEAFFGKKPLCHLDPDQVVARGAAMQAAVLARHDAARNILLLDVLPLSLGIEMLGGIVEKLLLRNTAIPTRAVQEVTTAQDNQTDIVLHVVQGEREMAADCRSLAQIDIPVDPMLAGKVKVTVIFQVDADGLLTVEAREEHTGKQVQVIVKSTYGLTEEEVLQRIEEADRHAEADMWQRRYQETCQEATLFLEGLQKALERDGHLLDEPQRALLLRQITDLRDALAAKAFPKIVSLLRELQGNAQEFAEKRLQAALSQVEGKSIQEWITTS